MIKASGERELLLGLIRSTNLPEGGETGMGMVTLRAAVTFRGLMDAVFLMDMTHLFLELGWEG